MSKMEEISWKEFKEFLSPRSMRTFGIYSRLTSFSAFWRASWNKSTNSPLSKNAFPMPLSISVSNAFLKSLTKCSWWRWIFSCNSIKSHINWWPWNFRSTNYNQSKTYNDSLCFLFIFRNERTWSFIKCSTHFPF